jgi:hypothetical protein
MAREDFISLLSDVTTATAARSRRISLRADSVVWRRIADHANAELGGDLDRSELDDLVSQLWYGGSSGAEPVMDVRRTLVRTLTPSQDVSGLLALALITSGDVPGPARRDAAVRAVAGQTLGLVGQLLRAPAPEREELGRLLEEAADQGEEPDTDELMRFLAELVRPGADDRLLRPSDLPRLTAPDAAGAVDLSRIGARLVEPLRQVDPALEPEDPAGAARLDRPGLVLPDWAEARAPTLALLPVLAGVVGRAPAEVPSLPSLPPPDEDRLNVGLVRADSPAKPIRSGVLAADTDHLVWVSVGPPDDEAVPGEPAPVDLADVPSGEALDVVLFADAALLVPGEATAGSFVTGAVRPLTVLRPAAPPPVDSTTRLWFRIRTPVKSGRHTVRICVYHRGLLLQARQLTLPSGNLRTGVHSHALTYRIVSSPTAGVSTTLAPRRLSLYANASADGSHYFALHGQDGTPIWDGGGQFSSGDVRSLVSSIRGGLQMATWGTPSAWKPGKLNAYRAPDKDGFGESHDKLRRDLFELARRGYKGWDLVTSRFASLTERRRLRDLMRRPGGLVEVAPRQESTIVPPVACLYDLPLDTEAEYSRLKLCPEADGALRARAELLATACFRDGCEHAGPYVVCPSGFWGLRHDVSVPLSCGVSAGKSPRTTIGVTAPRGALIGTLPERLVGDVATHADEVASRFAVHEHVTDREAWFAQACRGGRYAVHYFLCHGQQREDETVIILDRLGQPGISRSNLESMGVVLDHRPLVVLNACETGALWPDQAISLLEGFTYHGAGAVVGAEITVFTSLAYAFATTFLDRFITAAPRGLGAALRETRLDLLRRGNPLGLAYVGYGLADAAAAG